MSDSVTGEYVNDADVTANLTDTGGTSLGTFTLDYVSGSSGDYRGTLAASVAADLTACANYIVEITATSGDSIEFRRETHLCEYRGYE